MSFIAFAPLHVFKIKITKRTITKTQKGKKYTTKHNSFPRKYLLSVQVYSYYLPYIV